MKSCARLGDLHLGIDSSSDDGKQDDDCKSPHCVRPEFCCFVFHLKYTFTKALDFCECS